MHAGHGAFSIFDSADVTPPYRIANAKVSSKGVRAVRPEPLADMIGVDRVEKRRYLSRSGKIANHIRSRTALRRLNISQLDTGENLLSNVCL